MSDEEKVKGKGFVITDRRGFTPEGEVKSGTDVTEEKKKEDEKKGAQKDTTQKKEEMPLPEINFPSFVLSLSSSALLHFGQIPDPITKKQERNLPLAKQTIDILGILQEKTKGNLTKDEEQLIENLLHDLRLKYVEESRKG